MTMNTANADLERLAALDEPCPGIRVSVALGRTPDEELHDTRCCGGALRVAHFPMLRKPCFGIKGEWGSDCIDGKVFAGDQTCPTCQGRGWVPVSGAEAVAALMDACRSLPEYMGVSFTARGQVALSLVHLPVLYKSCDTDLEALAAALWAAQLEVNNA